MVSPRHYTVDPMLSASGNLFKCHEEVLFYFLPLYWYCAPASEFGARPKGGGIASSSFFGKKQKQKTS